jgi:hypothetical protein
MDQLAELRSLVFQGLNWFAAHPCPGYTANIGPLECTWIDMQSFQVKFSNGEIYLYEKVDTIQ